MSEKKVFGIDLGTTYSCIAHVDEHGKPVIIPNKEGDLTTPSVVFFENEENIVVGQAAKETVAVEPDQCVSTVKRVMGDPHWEFECLGKTYKPQDISSFILRKLVEDAESVTGETVEDVVITCPAYFGVNEKEATKQAGSLAGLNVRYVIPEPTAAALAYGINQEKDQVIMVYDLGGGTFDISIIGVKTGEINVVCTGGDHQLGGKNWDDAIVSYFASEFEKETGISQDELIEDLETYQELLNAAERCKKTLSNRDSVREPVRHGGKRVKVELTRGTFNEITNQYLERTLSLTEQEIEKAKKKGTAKIDKLLLVGGSTYMPQVLEAVAEKFPMETLQFDPNQAVAKGASVYGFKYQLEAEIIKKVEEKTGQSNSDIHTLGGAVVEEAQKEVAEAHGLALPGMKNIIKKKITNVTSKGFGIVVHDRSQNKEVVANLIYADDKVPTEIMQKFGTHEDGQIQADLRCMENLEREPGTCVEVGTCRELGQAVLGFEKPLPVDSPVEITFSLGDDGLLSVKGLDLTTNREVIAEFKTDSIMTREQETAAKSRNLAMAVS